MKKLIESNETEISRRSFFKLGSSVLAGGALLAYGKKGGAQPGEDTKAGQTEGSGTIVEHRLLGRTGFNVSDISMGCGRINEANVVRYAYDKGINYFDHAETYGNGESEKKMGEVMKNLDRKKIFITTKMVVRDDDTKETVINRFRKSLGRLQTEYTDALYMHSVKKVEWLNHESFHAAVAELKQEGRLKHAGVSSHGPRSDDQDSMEKVLVAAAEDGRFDLMLLVYNFMNKEAGEKILAACKKNNVGSTIMKAAPGTLKVDPFDPDNPSKEYAEDIERMKKRGISREEAIRRIHNWIAEQKEALEKTRPFAEKYHIKTEELLKNSSIKWVLQNKDMHTVCVSLPDFDQIDNAVGLSGSKLTASAQKFLNQYEMAFNRQYCRHGCSECYTACPGNVPVSAIMRYAYYYDMQGREKYAMEKYARLKGKDVSLCQTCDGGCENRCPYGVDIQSNLLRAHSRLTFA